MKKMLDALPKDTRTPYQRFEELAKEIFAVPKEEINKRVLVYGRKKKKKRIKKEDA